MKPTKQTVFLRAKDCLKKKQNDLFVDRIVTCDEKWVYYDNHVRGRNWFKQEEPVKQVTRRTLTNRKELWSIGWDIHGVIFYDFLPSGQTINADKYCVYLDQVQQNLIKKSPLWSTKITELGWTTMEHPPYNPDLAPCDFHLFRSLQNYFSGSKLASAEESKNEVTSLLVSRSPDFFPISLTWRISR